MNTAAYKGLAIRIANMSRTELISYLETHPNAKQALDQIGEDLGTAGFPAGTSL